METGGQLRAAGSVFAEAFRLYARFPLLFAILAAAVIVPYQLLLLALTGSGGSTSHNGFGAETSILLVDTLLVGPLISALHVHAVRQIRLEERPELLAVAKAGLVALPVVAAATVMSLLGVAFGLLALIVPGILLWCRWAVVAQSAAIEPGGWLDAMKHSESLTAERYREVFAILIGSFLLSAAVTGLIKIPFGDGHSAPGFIAWTLIEIVLASLTALFSAVLFFDLTTRLESRAARVDTEREPLSTNRSGRVVAPTGHPLDPDSYSDEDRPHGWYIVPDAPWKMRYWPGDGPDGFSERRAKTPKDVQTGWYKVNDR